MIAAAGTVDHGFTGLTGFAADVLTALGDVGVGILVFIEVLVPPIPSEVILPFAGYLSQSGDLHLGPLIFWSTLASLIGALLLYWLGSAIGMTRAIRLLAATRLISRSDLDRGSRWFVRHGTWTVLVGRVVPGVRSLISLPAGAARMNLVRFILYTVIGSGAWNSLLIGLGAALGTQHERLSGYLDYVDYVVYAALALGLVVLITRRVREARNSRRDPLPAGGGVQFATSEGDEMTSDDVNAEPGDDGGTPAPQQDRIDGIVAQVIADHMVGSDGDPIHLLDQRLAESGIRLDETERAAVEQRVRDSL